MDQAPSAATDEPGPGAAPSEDPTASRPSSETTWFVSPPPEPSSDLTLAQTSNAQTTSSEMGNETPAPWASNTAGASFTSAHPSAPASSASSDVSQLNVDASAGDATSVEATVGSDSLDAGAPSSFAPTSLVDTASIADATTTETTESPCTFGEFGAPKVVTGLGHTDRLWGPAVSSDGHTLFFGYTGSNEDLFQATLQDAATAKFGNVTALTRLNTSSNEGTPFLSYDGLTLYFYSTRAGGEGDRDLWSASRGQRSGEFDNPELVAGVNGPSYDHLPWLSDDELTIYYTTERDGGLGHSDIWMATRTSKAEAFANHTLAPGLNTDAREDAIAFTADGLTAFFTTDRATGSDLDIWQATRRDAHSSFDDLAVMAVLNSEQEDTNLALTRDGTQLYFSSGRNGKQQLWVATRPPGSCSF